MQAAPLERLGQLACPVGGENNHRPVGGTERTEFRDTDLKVAQHFQQKRLELLVGLVDLVDQQHDLVRHADRPQQGPLQQICTRENVRGDLVPPLLLGGVGVDAQELLLIVPLVQGTGFVEPFVTLQAHQLGVQEFG